MLCSVSQGKSQLKSLNCICKNRFPTYSCTNRLITDLADACLEATVSRRSDLVKVLVEADLARMNPKSSKSVVNDVVVGSAWRGDISGDAVLAI